MRSSGFITMTMALFLSLDLAAAPGVNIEAAPMAELQPPARLFCLPEYTDGSYPEIEVRDDLFLEPQTADGKSECIYKIRLKVVGQNIDLDCQGALLKGKLADGSVGLQIGHPDQVLNPRQIHVKNCRIENYDLNFAVYAKNRAADEMKAPGTDRIVIEDSRSINAKRHGFFLGPLVSGILLKKVEATGSGGSGIYMAPGAQRNIVVSSRLIGNGRDAGQNDRNGVSLDTASRNQIVANLFEDNGLSGLSTFRSCGEGGREVPSGSADANTIRANHFRHEKTGVWIASRQSLNQKALACSAAKTFKDTDWDIIEDFSKDNQIAKNLFTEVAIGARIEDDNNRLVENNFRSEKPESIAALIGSRFGRPRALRRPIEKTLIEDNRLSLKNERGFQYCFLHAQSRIQGNRTGAGVVSTPLNQLNLASDRMGLAAGGCAIRDAVPGPTPPAPAIPRGLASEPPTMETKTPATPSEAKTPTTPVSN